MDDRRAKGAASLGLLGALATMFSVWWFALRPRRRQRGS